MWTVLVCPRCETEVMPPGNFRTICATCETYYSIEDERPDDRDKYPDHWERRQKHRYPVPGKRVEVVAAASRTKEGLDAR